MQNSILQHQIIIMHKLSFLALIALFFACGTSSDKDKKKTQVPLLTSPYNGQIYHSGEKIKVEIAAEAAKGLDSIRYTYGNESQKLPANQSIFYIETQGKPLGNKTLSISLFSKGQSKNENLNLAVLADAEPEILSFKIVNTYPHDTKAFTEGLEYINGFLYESTGQYEISDIRKVNPKSGQVLQKQALAPQYFGEGMTKLGDKFYQLTYKEKTGFVYDADFKQLTTFPIATQEGWGLTNDGTHLIQSDGSHQLFFINPSDFKVAHTLDVCNYQQTVAEVNELEYVEGFIYANVWKTETLLKIDAETGKVVATLDLSPLAKEIYISNTTDVLNGIAYDKKTKHFWITGKNWDKIFEIEIFGKGV